MKEWNNKKESMPQSISTQFRPLALLANQKIWCHICMGLGHLNYLYSALTTILSKSKNKNK